MQEKPKHALFHKILLTIAIAVCYFIVLTCALYALLPTFFTSFFIAVYILIVLTVYGTKLGKLIDKNGAERITVVLFWIFIFVVLGASLLVINWTGLVFDTAISGLEGRNAPSTVLQRDFLWISAILSFPIVLITSLVSVYFIKRDEDAYKAPQVIPEQEKEMIKQNTVKG